MAAEQRSFGERTAWARNLAAPLRDFLSTETGGAIALLAATVAALLWANSPWKDAYDELWLTRVSVGIGSWSLDKDLRIWIDDGLMALFFVLVGLEIKREVVSGELRDRRAAMLPALASLGGMIEPALVYVAFAGRTAPGGWGVPMATDIAFVVGVMAAFGKRVPFGLKIFLLSLAIADDMGAVVVIAAAYTEFVNLGWLGLAASGLGLCVLLNQLGVRPVAIYLMVGAVTWLAMYLSQIHPTIAGVLLGMFLGVSSYSVGPLTASAFSIVVLGGLGSVTGSLIAAYVVGYLETATAYLVSPAYRVIPALLLLVAVMYLRPQGLLGRR